jgi:hypothetical protein
MLLNAQVLSETDQRLAQRQVAATLEEVLRWGCHLDRRTLEEVKAAGFATIRGIDGAGVGAGVGQGCYLELPGVDLMGPTVAGIAVME